MNAISEPTTTGVVEVSAGDVMSAVREAAMLADVSISVWGAERSDTTLMEKVKQDAGAVGNVGRVLKNTLAGADGKLKDLKAAFNAVRTLHYRYTLPWVSDPHAQRQSGPRLLPHLLFPKYTTELSTQRRKALDMLDAFIADYPALVAQAKANLGGLADQTYPSPDEVRAAFRVSFDFEPLPSGASFKGLDPFILERLSKGLQSKQDRMLATAAAVMWERVRERVTHIVERLTNEDATFRASTVENVRELLTLLPGWNVAGDPRVQEIVDGVQSMFAGVRLEALRKDEALRVSTAQKGKAIVDRLSQWGL